MKNWKVQMEKVCFIENQDIQESLLLEIIQLKEQHWSHGIDSQKKWIKCNLQKFDKHCILYTCDKNKKDKKVIAYLNLIDVNGKFNNKLCKCIGIGNVCVDKKYEHMGYGRLLLKEVNKYLEENNFIGVLLCKLSVEEFYSKVGWKKLEVQYVNVNGVAYTNIVMVYNGFQIPEHICKVYFDRNF